MDPDLQKIQLELEEIEAALVEDHERIAFEAYNTGVEEVWHKMSSLEDQAYKEGYDAGYQEALYDLERLRHDGKGKL